MQETEDKKLAKLARFQVILRDGIQEEVDSRAEPYNRGIARSEVINTDLGRYYALLADARRDLREKLTGSEAALVCDVLNGTLMDDRTARYIPMEIEDALEDPYAEKWGVDGGALLQKLRGLSVLELYALADAVERFWKGSSRGEDVDGKDILR